MVGANLLFCLVPFLHICITFNLAVVVQAMGLAELQLRTSRQDSIHHTAGCRLTADRRPLADKAIGTMLDSLGSLTFELLYPQPHCFL